MRLALLECRAQDLPAQPNGACGSPVIGPTVCVQRFPVLISRILEDLRAGLAQAQHHEADSIVLAAPVTADVEDAQRLTQWWKLRFVRQIVQIDHGLFIVFAYCCRAKAYTSAS